MTTYTEIIEKLKAIKEMGYIKTHRKGTTGIGKTLEDLLEITENNIPGPNAGMIELKSARKNVLSMLTLFTKSPLPRKANSVLLQRFGYESARGNKRKELHTTVNAKGYNQLKGKPGFKIDIKNERIDLITAQNEILGYWDKETLRNSFERKLPKLLYVKAEARGKGFNEEFYFNEAWLLSGFNFNNFLNLLREGIILVDIRIGQYPNGRPHDHGTGFRVFPDKLDLCFKNRKRIMRCQKLLKGGSMRKAQKRGYGYEKQQAYKRGVKPMGGPGKPDFKEGSRKSEVKNWKKPVPRPEVVKAVRNGVKKFISKSGFTEPAINYAKENKKITLIKKGKVVVKRTK